MIRARLLRWLPWLLGSGLVVAVFLVNTISVSRGNLPSIALWRNDFTNLWSGGHFVALGDYARLYDVKAFGEWQWARFEPFGPRFFSYPPTIFPLTQIAALLPYKAALLVWLAATAALFVLAARQWRPEAGGPIWLVLLTPAALLNISMGQMAFLLGAMWLAIFALVDRRPALAGLLIAGFLIKPQLAIFLPLVLILTRRWVVFAWAAGATLALLALNLLIYGIEPWTQFIDQAVPRQSAFIHIARGFQGTHTTSIFTVVEYLTGNSIAGAVAHMAAAGWALFVIVRAVRLGASTIELALIVSTATFLVLPYALSYDLVVPAIAAWRIMASELVDRQTKIMAALGFIGPQLTVLSGAISATPILPFMLALLFAAQARMLKPTGRDALANAALAH